VLYPLSYEGGDAGSLPSHQVSTRFAADTPRPTRAGPQAVLARRSALEQIAPLVARGCAGVVADFLSALDEFDEGLRDRKRWDAVAPGGVEQFVDRLIDGAILQRGQDGRRSIHLHSGVGIPAEIAIQTSQRNYFSSAITLAKASACGC
jgi:hypothetical protein